ncbi:MAG: fibrobacter succinogenes major paralogous domain-containing protein [Bacteroidales bacterium]|nr:fibrobacter succinogenes major paralogous domain-containing protein [Bacteroidales bacterium]
MKRIVLSMLAVLGVSVIMQTEVDAQMYIVKDGKVKVALDYTPDYITFENPMLCGGVVGEPVDLGLSVNWSSVNVGASTSDNFGNYYSWGEIDTKDDYSWNTYIHSINESYDYSGISKYQIMDNLRGGRWYDYDNNKQFIGDNKVVLETADDAASVNWGGDWIIPTKEDWQELFNNCYMIWTNDYNKDDSKNAGYIVKSKDKNNTSSIFLPVAGMHIKSDLCSEGIGYYLTSSLDNKTTISCSTVGLFSGYFSIFGSSRECGVSVRPICPHSGDTNSHDAVDLGLPSGKLWATCNIGSHLPEEKGGHYAWGEVTTKSDYSWSTYKHVYDGGSNYRDINKYTIDDGVNIETAWYNSSTGIFIGDNKSILEPTDDVATQNWGTEWRIPTWDEWMELYINTTQEWIENYNATGVNGYKLTSTKEGYTNAFIFLPVAGYIKDSSLTGNGLNGYYWTSSIFEKESDLARYVTFSMNSFYVLFEDSTFGGNYCARSNGMSIRPVCPSTK